MFIKLRSLTIVAVLFFTFSHCSKKTSPKASKTPENLKNEIIATSDVADQEIGKMINEMSDMGFQNKAQMTSLIDQFNKTNDKFEKYKLCSPILLAQVSYKLRAKVNKDIPELSEAQLETIKKADQHCRWAAQTINKFENSLTDRDFKKISEGVPNSLLPVKKSLFSSGRNCTTTEYENLLKLNRQLYTDTKVLGAVLIMVAIQTDGNIRAYAPNYRKVIEKSNSIEKDFLLRFVDYATKSKDSARDIEQKKESLLKATKAFSEAGIKSIPKFLVQSVSAAPNCFSSVRSGLVDVAKLVVTGDRMKNLYVRLADEVKKSGDLPKLKPVEKANELNDLETSFLQQLITEKVDTRDKWFRPFMISGNKNSFKVVSAGKDRTPGTSDDISYPSK